tara:strand:- start:1359 stop:1544 length:186 start_codon:yes stop_codon:yes gene_type:complete
LHAEDWLHPEDWPQPDDCLHPDDWLQPAGKDFALHPLWLPDEAQPEEDWELPPTAHPLILL